MSNARKLSLSLTRRIIDQAMKEVESSVLGIVSDNLHLQTIRSITLPIFDATKDIKGVFPRW